MGQVARANLLQNRKNGGIRPRPVLVNLKDVLVAHPEALPIILRQPCRSKPVWAFTYAPLRDWCR